MALTAPLSDQTRRKIIRYMAEADAMAILDEPIDEAQEQLTEMLIAYNTPGGRAWHEMNDEELLMEFIDGYDGTEEDLTMVKEDN